MTDQAVTTDEIGYLRACIAAAAQSPESFDLAVLLPRIARVLDSAAAAAQAAADEREACALLADYYAEQIACRECGSEAAYSAARLIRLRGGLLAGTADGAHTPGGTA